MRFYISNAQGFDGFIFSDAGPRHEYITERPAPPVASAPVAVAKAESVAASNGAAPIADGAVAAVAEAKVEPPQLAPEKITQKRVQSFLTLRETLAVSWAHTKGKHRLSPGMFATWAAWDLRAEHGDGYVVKAEEVQKRVEELLKNKGVDERFVFKKQGIQKEAFFK